MTGEESRRDLMELDLAVHRIVDRAASSPYLEETLVRLDGLVTRLWCLLIDRLPAMRDHVGEHIPLMEAILEGGGRVDGGETRPRALSIISILRSEPCSERLPDPARKLLDAGGVG